MPFLRVVLALMWVMTFIGVRALLDSSTAVSGAGLHRRNETPLVGGTSAGAGRRPAASRPRVDLYGNPIDEAISDYRVDGRGDMYERRAPHTALLELGSPGT